MADNNVRSGPWTRGSPHLSMGAGSSVDNGGEPPDDGRMEERVKKLEELADKTVERVVNIERDVAVIKSNYATREDISKLGAAMQAEINAQTWKMILWTSSFGTALVGATYFLATHLGK